MADSKISALPAATSFAAADILPISQSGTTKGLTMGTLLLPTSTTPDVYIAFRTDGIAGNGTINSPYDGSTQAKFDACMGAVGTNTVIHIGPGTFQTIGGNNYSVKAGQKIYGAGMGNTIIQLVQPATPWSNNTHIHFATYGLYDEIEIHDLTCDGNFAGMTFTGGFASHAHDVFGGMIISGNNTRIENVETINCYGDTTNGYEQFSILIGGINHTTPASNCKILNCVTHQYAAGANYTNGPDIAYGSVGLISGCYDDGSNHAFGFTDWSDGKLVNCTSTSNTQKAFYTDTGNTSNIVIAHNTLAASLETIELHGPLASNYRITDNYLTNSNSSGQASAVALTGTAGSGFIITNNIFNWTGTTIYAGIVQNNGPVFTGLFVEGNTTINAGLSAGSLNAVVNANSYAGYNMLNGIYTLGTFPALFATSTASTTVTNSATFTTATGCTTAALPQGTYKIEALIVMQPSSSQQASAQLLASHSLSWNGQFIYNVGGAAGTYNGGAINTGLAIGFIEPSANIDWCTARFSGIITVLTAGTTISWQFCQNPVAGAGNTLVVPSGAAYIILTRIA